MKKWIISVGSICAVVLFLFVIDYNHPVARAQRLCQKVYAQLQALPAVRMEVVSVVSNRLGDGWKKREEAFGTYWISGEDSLNLRRNGGYLMWDGVCYETATKYTWNDNYTWRTSDKKEHGIWDESFDLLTHGQYGMIQHTEEGMEVRFRGPAYRCCTGYYGEAVVFCFDKNSDLTAIGWEYVNYSHAGVGEENVTYRRTNLYRITSLDAALVRQELEQQAEAILEKAH